MKGKQLKPLSDLSHYSSIQFGYILNILMFTTNSSANFLNTDISLPILFTASVSCAVDAEVSSVLAAFSSHITLRYQL